jgi:hypothetical protein
LTGAINGKPRAIDLGVLESDSLEHGADIQTG